MAGNGDSQAMRDSGVWLGDEEPLVPCGVCGSPDGDDHKCEGE